MSGAPLAEPFLVEGHVATTMGEPHWHDHVELNLLLSGRMAYRFDGADVAVEPGRLALFWAAMPHQSVAVEAGSRIVCAYLPVAEFMALPIDGVVRGAISAGAFLSAGLADAADAILFPRWAGEWESGDPRRRALLRDELLQRVRRAALDPDLSLSGPRRAATGLAANRAGRMVEIVNARFAEPLGLPTVAAELGIHAATAASSFRVTLGMSFHDYLTRRRLGEAKRLLAASDLSIAEIAFSCGFGSLGRFYASFGASEGTTPRCFRAAARPR